MMYVFFLLQLETRGRQRPATCPGQRRRGLSLVEILISIGHRIYRATWRRCAVANRPSRLQAGNA